MASVPKHDIVLYGASGFTGALVAEYLAQRLAGPGSASWALAGRSRAKLEKVRTEIGAPHDLPLIEADSENVDAMRALAAQARVVISTVGPYQLYGSNLVAACAELGLGYVDLCGEPNWMRAMIDAHEATAKANGARIVFSCGFDSIPFDLGVFRLQGECARRFGRPAPRIKGRVRSMKGGFSGGTAASMKATMGAAAKDARVRSLLLSPFALTPGFEGASQPSGLIPEYDRDAGAWAIPFIMAPINTKTVHRSNRLLGALYGRDFRYDEMQLTSFGEAAKAAAEAMARFNPLSGESGPKPGEGPSREERESGSYDILFTAELPGGEKARLSVKGDRDPGYGSTSKMLAESALCLLETNLDGGFWTPASAMGDALVARLETHAGLVFTIEG